MNINDTNKLKVGERVLLRGAVINDGGMKMLQVGGVAISIRPELVACGEDELTLWEDIHSGYQVPLPIPTVLQIAHEYSLLLLYKARAIEAKCGLGGSMSDFESQLAEIDKLSDYMMTLRSLIYNCKGAMKLKAREQEGGHDDEK